MNAAAAGAILIVVTSHGQIDPQHPTGNRSRARPLPACWQVNQLDSQGCFRPCQEPLESKLRTSRSFCSNRALVCAVQSRLAAKLCVRRGKPDGAQTQ